VKNKLSFLENANLEKIIVVFTGYQICRSDGIRYFGHLLKWKVMKILWRQCLPFVRVRSVVKAWDLFIVVGSVWCSMDFK